MSSQFDEGCQRFTFDAQWQVVKYDAHRDYLDKIQKLEKSKAADFVGLCVNDDLFFIEVKDFRGYRIENKKRLTSDQLAIEVALKVRDSIAGVIGAYRTSSLPEEWRPFARALANRDRLVRVILWVEDDKVKRPAEWAPRAKVLQEVLKTKLRWLTTRVLVVNNHIGPPPAGLTVVDLPRAGQPRY